MKESDFGCRPLLTPKPTALCVLLIGLLFLVLGITFVLNALLTIECVKPYGLRVFGEIYNSKWIKPSDCRNMGNKTKFVAGPVYIYYQLENFNQNDAAFMNSKLDEQLRGTIVTDRDKVKKHCGEHSFYGKDGKILHPCGAYAASFFNDTLHQIYEYSDGLDSRAIHISRSREELAWASDLRQFKNPPDEEKRKYSDQVYFWLDHFGGPLKEEHMMIAGKGVENAHFVNWMTPAAMPDFRNLWGVVKEGINLPATVSIHARYDAGKFHAVKSIVFSQQSFAGGSTMYLGVTYCVMSVILFTVAMFLYFRLKVCKTA